MSSDSDNRLRERVNTRYPSGPNSRTLSLWALIIFAPSALLNLLTRLGGSGDATDRYRQWAIGGLFVSMALAGTALFVARNSRRRAQPLRDAAVSNAGPYVLFLRPFFLDDRLRLRNPFSKGAILSFEPSTMGPEEFVGRVLEPYMDVCQIGGGPSTFGAGRILVPDEEWQTAFRAVTKAAKAIIVIPGLRLGRKLHEEYGLSTIWELQQLSANGMDRTIVMMPPRIGWRLRSFRKEWQNAKVRCLRFGLALPAYSKRGGLFVFERSALGGWEVAAEFRRQRFWYRHRGFAESLVDALVHQAKRHGFELNDDWLSLPSG